MQSRLIDKINSLDFVVGIAGLGYVGLPLLYYFAKKGFPVIGFDVDKSKIDTLEQGKSYIEHISETKIQEIQASKRFTVTTDYSNIGKCDAVLITVPTPLTANREPDMRYIIATCESIYPILRRGQIVILESTTYPGTTTDIVVPMLEKSGLKCGEDFFVAYSPEREDPNNPEYTANNIPKVVGADSEAALAVATALYNQIFVSTYTVNSTKVAEMTKLLENIFRAVNIALVNELKVALMQMDIDIWDVIEAARTKPFGFMPFYPGPGLGGHCIPIDPFYLTWKAKQYGVHTKFIELAGEVNTAMPDFVISRVMQALNEQNKALSGSRILILGMAYKSNVDDIRESPALRLLADLENQGAIVAYNDPHIPEILPSHQYSQFAGRRSVEVSGNYDLILIATAHTEYYQMDLTGYCIPVVDTRNVVKSSSKWLFKA